MTGPIVIVGAGMAGANAAKTLREEGFDGPLTLVGDEPEPPYERPPLSKGYLMGKDERDSAFVHPRQWYADAGVELRVATRVERIDRDAHRVVLVGGQDLPYDTLLLTTGSSPRPLPVDGAHLGGVLHLRTLQDSDRLKETIAASSRIAVVGAGWIGLETAAAAREAGVEVTVLEMADLPLLRVLGPEVAQVFADLHRAHGVDLRLGISVAEITGDDGRVTGVRLGDGTHVPADAVVVGAGISPNVALAQDAGLDVDNGVKVDEHLRSSDPDIFAAGDVANAFHPALGRHVRVEHWANARHQPRTAARAMLGRDEAYDRIPYFFTDQYDLGMEYTGYVEPGGYDEVVFRGDRDGGEFVAFWVGGGRVLAGMNVNVWDVADTIEALVRDRGPVDVTALADPDRPLDSLLKG
ncbi:MAG: NAD(P)/FAD-dependent oxidoreductase [Actinobacteria bacterium]|nr:NAD(P)/FAD-dependent oxidoreductase [Actinomycetota bacterium]